MFITKSHLTFALFSLTVLLSSTTSDALGHTDVRVSGRQHNEAKRFVKKRSPFPQEDDAPLIPPINVGGDPESVTSTTASTTTTSETSSTSTALPSSSSVSSTSVSSASSISSVSSSSASSSASSSSEPVSSSSESLSSTSLSSSSLGPSTTSSTSEPTLNVIPVQTSDTAESTNTPSTRTLTQSLAASESSAAPSQPPEQSGGLSTKGATITAIIAVVASIGGILVIWTIFRKWKLSRSKSMDKRMQPIDWQPSLDDGIPGHHRRASDTSSFHSGNGHGGSGATSDAGHGGSNHGHGNLGPLPDHDFTAGPSTVGGYADLTRGPSPQPTMQEALNRGPSLTRPNYDTNVPLHHQNGYGNGY